eukprot:PhM_4_TR16737/c1_g2_i1/m.30522
MKPTFEVKSTLVPRGNVTEQCHFSGDGQDYAEKRVQSRNEVSEDALEINSNKNKDIHYPQNESAGQRDVSKQIRKHKRDAPQECQERTALQCQELVSTYSQDDRYKRDEHVVAIHHHEGNYFEFAKWKLFLHAHGDVDRMRQYFIDLFSERTDVHPSDYAHIQVHINTLVGIAR